MKKIVTIAAVAAFATLAACGTETATVPADENATEAATENATQTPAEVREELKVDKQKNPNEQIP